MLWAHLKANKYPVTWIWELEKIVYTIREEIFTLRNDRIMAAMADILPLVFKRFAFLPATLEEQSREQMRNISLVVSSYSELSAFSVIQDPSGYSRGLFSKSDGKSAFKPLRIYAICVCTQK